MQFKFYAEQASKGDSSRQTSFDDIKMRQKLRRCYDMQLYRYLANDDSHPSPPHNNVQRACYQVARTFRIIVIHITLRMSAWLAAAAGTLRLMSVRLSPVQ